MKQHQYYFLLLSVLITFGSKLMGQNVPEASGKEVYRSSALVILQIGPNSFQHISFLQTDDFGRVPCNGLVVRDKKEVIIFDTPTQDKSAEELIKWVETALGAHVKAIIPTHFHNDCLGGLNAFTQHHIPSYGYRKTLEMAKENGIVGPQNPFQESQTFTLGQEKVQVKFLGEGHTRDNVVAYFEKDQILFGGCLIKELQASKGFLGDANVSTWASTVEHVKNTFPDVKVVVPGHGLAGNKQLLDYTISLFK